MYIKKIRITSSPYVSFFTILYFFIPIYFGILWLHVCVAKDENTFSNRSTWEGKLKAMKREIGSVKREMKKEMKKNIDVVKKDIDVMKKDMGDINKKLDDIMELLTKNLDHHLCQQFVD